MHLKCFKVLVIHLKVGNAFKGLVIHLMGFKGLVMHLKGW